jgi:CRP/FNR family transcriptional regulator, anaerobic regulatory protein
MRSSADCLSKSSIIFRMDAGRGSLNTDNDLPDGAEVANLIARSLPGARPETRAALLGTAQVRTFEPDDLIWRQGETTRLTQMVRGYGAFRRTTVDGGQHIVSLSAPGTLFGFSSIASVETPTDLVALTRVLAVLWPGHEIRPLAARDPGLALDVIDRMAEFLLRANERVDGLLYQDTRRRVLRVLTNYRDLFFGEPAVLSRAHLPSLVGTTREMTSRVIRALESEGVVARVGRRGLALLSAESLQRALASSAGHRAGGSSAPH